MRRLNYAGNIQRSVTNVESVVRGLVGPLAVDGSFRFATQPQTATDAPISRSVMSPARCVRIMTDQSIEQSAGNR